MTQGNVSISIVELRVGATCTHPVTDDNGLLLLGAGTRITHQLITGLRERGVDSIQVDRRDTPSVSGNGLQKKAAAKRERKTGSGWVESKPVKEMLVDRHHEGLSDERAEQLQRDMGLAIERFTELTAKMAQGEIPSVGPLNDISDQYIRSMVDDHDQTIGAIGSSTKSHGPEERAVRMSVLGMALAVELDLDAAQTLEVGMAGLLHDIGLRAMDEAFQKPIELMSEAERWEYRKHPHVSASCVAELMDVPPSVQLAIEQVHEQFDGSGYPRGVKGKLIHVYARILNVVDTYLQLTSITAGRRSIVPHDALAFLLHQARRGIFDPKVIRGFLNIETLFPLGSMVELSSGEIARVIRRPKNGFAEPVLVDRDGNRIELESTSLEVSRPVCDPETEQMRLSPEMMQASHWHPATHSQVV